MTIITKVIVVDFVVIPKRDICDTGMQPRILRSASASYGVLRLNCAEVSPTYVFWFKNCLQAQI